MVPAEPTGREKKKDDHHVSPVLTTTLYSTGRFEFLET